MIALRLLYHAFGRIVNCFESCYSFLQVRRSAFIIRCAKACKRARCSFARLIKNGQKTLGNTAQFPPYGLSTAPAAAARHLCCQNARQCRVAVPASCFGSKSPRTLRPLPLLWFAVSATGGAHLCSTKYCLRFWLSSCRTSLAVSALRIMRYCPKASVWPQEREGFALCIKK